MSREGHSFLGDILIGIFSIVLALPVFIIAHKKLPDPDWSFSFDRILLFIGIVILLLMVLKLFRAIVIIGFIVAFAWLGWGTWQGGYGFADIYRDYRAMLFAMHSDPNPERLIFTNGQSFPYSAELQQAIEKDHPAVRQFALAATNDFFKEEQNKYPEYRRLIQCFAIFKKINSSWNYVEDPQSKEYFARASESAKALAGDCDDYSILMASCLQSIGATVRFVHTTDHIYPEVLVDDKSTLEQMNYAIKKKLFVAESAGQPINFHEDDQGRIWLNLDYTAKYPGGPFMNEKVLGVLNL